VVVLLNLEETEMIRGKSSGGEKRGKRNQKTKVGQVM